jgi:hypothetical protein
MKKQKMIIKRQKKQKIINTKNKNKKYRKNK